MYHTLKINKTVHCDGTSLWGNTEGRPVTVKSVEFEVYDTEEPNSFFLVWVNHNRKWTIYTDEGFEKAVSKLVSQKIGAPVKLVFTEQGMQEDGRASMETKFKACDKNIRRYFSKKRK